jgi:hypothetical protein
MSVNEEDDMLTEEESLQAPLSARENEPESEQESNTPVSGPQEGAGIEPTPEQHLLEHTASPLRTVQGVLGFDERGRARMDLEGITEVEHIHDLEEMLRDGKVTGLTSVETVKLLQYLSWRSSFQDRTRGSLPDAQRDFTAQEFRLYKAGTSRTGYVWPFLDIWNVPDIYTTAGGRSPQDDDADYDEEQNTQLEDAPVVDPEMQNKILQEAFVMAEEYHREFHDGLFRKEVLRKAIESE